MPYQLSKQSVRKNCETPVHVAGSVGATRGGAARAGALVIRSASAASAPFGPDTAVAAKRAAATTMFLIKILPKKTRPHNRHRQRHSPACRRPNLSAPISLTDHPRGEAKYGEMEVRSQGRV